jgi:sulfate/thiosulfate-binding protein
MLRANQRGCAMTFGLRAALTSFLLATAFLAVGHAHAQQKALLNASSDTAREVFTAINPKFVDYWKRTSGEAVKIDQSFAASSRQAQDIIGGKRADTVTFNQVIDIDALVKRGMVTADWSKKFPNNASPYYSATAFLVRKGNPKNIRNWDDLARTDVKLVFPNPKTSETGVTHTLARGSTPTRNSTVTRRRSRVSSARCCATTKASPPEAVPPRWPSRTTAKATCWSPSRPRCRPS